MGDIWNAITDAFQSALEVLHGGLEPLFGTEAAWGWAIIALTVLVRLVLLPLAVKQTHSMRAMQHLQPKVKEIQDKYKVDRDMLKKDPERYKAKKSKMNEEVMALYREEGVNPAAGCLPLLLQAPIFFALFSVLRDTDFTALQESTFYFFTSQVSEGGLGVGASSAGWPGWLLILGMAVTMFVTQRQMMTHTNREGAQATQQKIMMYGMPVFLAFVAQGLPLGVLLYWVTTNLWQLGQQTVIFKRIEDGDGSEESSGAPSKKVRGSDNGQPSSKKDTKQKKPKKKDTEPESSPSAGDAEDGGGSEEADGSDDSGKKPKKSHTPSRRNRG